MSRTVLLIDDDLQFYSQLCQRLAGYDFEVHQADVSEESLTLAQELAADLIFIAVDLPDKVGFALCHKAKKLLSTPVILKTSTIPPEGFQKHSRLKSHADGYLDERTLTQEDLLAHVEALIGLGAPLETDDVDVGIEMEEVELDEIELDDFNAEPFEDEATAMPNEFLDESTKVAPSSPFLDPGLDAETDAAFAALGFDDDKPAPSFDTSDADVDDMDYMSQSPAVPNEEVTAVASDDAVQLAEAEAEAEDNNMGADALLDVEEEVSPQEPITYVAPDSETSEEELSAALEPEPSYELELDEDDNLAVQEEAEPLSVEAAPVENLSPVEVDDEADEITAFGDKGALPPDADSILEPISEQLQQSALVQEEAHQEEAHQEEAHPEEAHPEEDASESFASAETEDDLDLGLAAIAETAEEDQQAASHEEPLNQSALLAENARLKAELETAKKALASGGGEFSREHEFLDLREKINQKEKALLDVQDQVTAKDRALLDSKDQLRKLERSKSELDEKNLQLEHEVLSAKERQSSLLEKIKMSEEALAAANAAAAEELAQTATAHRDTIAGIEARQLQELSKAKSEHEAARASALEAAHEDHAAKIAQLESAMQAALAEAAAKLSEEMAAAALAKEQALKEQAEENRDGLAALEAEHEAARAEALAAFDLQKQALADQHAGKFSRLERESQEAREKLEADHASAAQEAAAQHQAALQEAAARHQEALEQAQAKAAAALAAMESEGKEALARLGEQHAAASAEAAKDHENALAEALAAADAQRKQELEVAAKNLQSLDERRRDELNAAAEEREASEAQLLAKATQDRAGLEAEHSEVVANFGREITELKTALSTSRDNIAQLEQELQNSKQQVEEQSGELQSKEQIIALRDDRIAALNGEISELEEQNASYQEQVLKAYQKIKSDESTTARAKKALAIALTLLDETADLGVETEPPHPDNESRS